MDHLTDRNPLFQVQLTLRTWLAGLSYSCFALSLVGSFALAVWAVHLQEDGAAGMVLVMIPIFFALPTTLVGAVLAVIFRRITLVGAKDGGDTSPLAANLVVLLPSASWLVFLRLFH